MVSGTSLGIADVMHAKVGRSGTGGLFPHMLPDWSIECMRRQPTLKLSAFNQQVTPELKGSVNKISAISASSTSAAALAYTRRASACRASLTQAPGTPVEAFFSTGSPDDDVLPRRATG